MSTNTGKLRSLLLRGGIPADVRTAVEHHLASLEVVVRAEEVFGPLGIHLEQGLVVSDSQGTTVYVNDRLCELVGASRTAMLGRPTIELVCSADRAETRERMRSRGSGAPARYLSHFHVGPASCVAVDIVPYPMFDGTGFFHGSFALVHRRADDGCPHAENTPGGPESRANHTPLDQTASLAGEPPRPPPPIRDPLSPREQTVVSLLAVGNAVDDVAQQLEISEHTVRNHLKHIYAKLDVHSEAELLRLILRTQLS